MVRLGTAWGASGLAALLALAAPGAPQAFRFEPEARAALHELWRVSVDSKTERVACLATRLVGDTISITGVYPLLAAADSLGVDASVSIETCGPPAWQGTVHTHVARYDGHRSYSLFSGADRGVMVLWWRRWRAEGVFCLLYSDQDVICEMNGESGVYLFPRARY